MARSLFLPLLLLRRQEAESLGLFAAVRLLGCPNFLQILAKISSGATKTRLIENCVAAQENPFLLALAPHPLLIWLYVPYNPHTKLSQAQWLPQSSKHRSDCLF